MNDTLNIDVRQVHAKSVTFLAHYQRQNETTQDMQSISDEVKADFLLKFAIMFGKIKKHTTAIRQVQIQVPLQTYSRQALRHLCGLINVPLSNKSYESVTFNIYY